MQHNTVKNVAMATKIILSQETSLRWRYERRFLKSLLENKINKKIKSIQRIPKQYIASAGRPTDYKKTPKGQKKRGEQERGGGRMRPQISTSPAEEGVSWEHRPKCSVIKGS